MARGSIRNPDSRVAGNAQGRASEFYKGKTQPVYGTISKKAPYPKKKAAANGRKISAVKPLSKPPVKRTGGR